jgi:hypothetical protein
MTDIEQWPACWQPHQQDLVVSEVGVQDDAVMLAVHEPPALRRRRVPLQGQLATAGAGVEATQEELLKHLLDAEPPEGTLIVPVIGAPGTGKSHLIRWMWAVMPQRDDLVIRHIPREGTSLPAVVERIFRGVEGEQFEAMKDALHKAQSPEDGIDPSARLERTASNLIYRITDLLQFGLGTEWRRARDVEPAVRDALCGPTLLPALLTDVEVRTRLTQPGGAAYRLAKDIVEGYRRAENEDQEELGFTAADLDLKVARNAGPHAHRTLARLRMSGNADAAARMMSDALDVASARLVLGSISLSDLLVDFRRVLAADGKQLVLLFEDIAIARGLQLDLIDAMTTPARRPGEAPLCNLRVAFAITNTYWEEQAPETLSTRARAWKAEMFDLDVPPAAAEERAPVLIGRYMNAARHGLDTIRTTDVETLRAGLANVCDTCVWQRSCHATFGATENGHGLYPLTTTAARRLSRIADAAMRPRLVLSEVVEPILDQQPAVDAHLFPAGQAWHTPTEEAVRTGQLRELSLPQLERLEQATAADRERARLVLLAWIGKAEKGTAVLTALGLPGEIYTDEGDDPAPHPDPVKPGPSPAPPAEHTADRAIQDWAAGTRELGNPLAPRLRTLIYHEVLTSIRWDELGESQAAVLEALGIRGPEQQRPALMIDIKGSAGGGGLLDSKRLITLEQSVENAQLLRAIWRRGRGGSRGRQAIEDLARVGRLVDVAEANARERLPTTRSLTQTAQLMNLAARVLAADLDPLREHWLPALQKLDKSVLADPPRGRAWNELRAKAISEYGFASGRIEGLATRSQSGRGSATAIDPALFDLARLDTDPTGYKRHPTEPDVRRRYEALLAQAEAAVAEEAATIGATLAAIARHTGSDESLPLKRIRDTVTEVLTFASQRHLLSGAGDFAKLQDAKLPPATAANDARAAARAAVNAAERGASPDALERLAQIDLEKLDQVLAYLTLAASVITTSADAARGALRQRAGGGIGSEGEQAREQARQIVAWCEERA